MKIVDVERIVVDVPFTERQQKITAREVYNWSILELCRVTSDSGHVGWGETVVHYTWARVSDDAVERVKGRPAAEVMNDDGLGSGLQMAVFDLMGRALEVPVHRLLGTIQRDWVPISWWSIDASPEDWAAEAADAVAAGYTSFKNKPRPWWDIVAQVEAISKVVPPHFKLDLDPNATWQNAAAAIPIIGRLEPFGNVAMFESPIPQDDLLGNRQIRRATSRPVAMHFGGASVHHLRPRGGLRRLRGLGREERGHAPGGAVRRGPDALLAAAGGQRPDDDLGRSSRGRPQPCHLAGDHLPEPLQPPSA